MHRGKGDAWAATSHLLVCNGRIADLFQLIKSSELIENVLISLISQGGLVETIEYHLCKVGTPLMRGFCQMVAANGSMKMVNSEGESGHPCLVPRCRMKLCDNGPLVITVTEGDM